MLIAYSSWPEIDARLKTTKTVVVPIGSNEQHGPTGLLGTDWMCPEIIAQAAETADDGLVVAPTFNIGMAQHHLAFAGTISLRPSTFMAAITDWVSSLSRHGFERIYFLNGHGGNVATIEATFSELYAEWSFVDPLKQRDAARRAIGEKGGAPYVLKLRNWWDLPGVMGLCNSLFPTGHGMHATPSEIAVTQAAWPDRIKTAEYSPRIAPNGPIRDALDYRARFPDGRIGSDPGQASPEKGRRIIDAAVPALLKDVAAFANETLPL
jgi:creatinine amidohydrolase/Fe(II)-dependent formamide hydrolase-like protein